MRFFFIAAPLFMFFYSHLIAQEKYIKGSIVRSNGNVQEGYLLFQDVHSNEFHCIFKPTQNGLAKEYSPLEVKEFEFINHAKFVSNQFGLKLDTTAIHFVQVLVTGAASLYYFNGVYYLEKGRYISSLNAPRGSKEFELHPSKGLHFLMSDCKYLNQREYSKIKYNHPNLIKLITNYNQKCYKIPVSIYRTRINNKPGLISLEAGPYYSTIDLPNLKDASSPLGLEFNINYLKKPSYYNNLFNYRLELAYLRGSHNSYSTSMAETGEYLYIETDFKYSLIRFTPNVEFSYQGKTTIYTLRVGSYFSYPVQFNGIVVTQERDQLANEITTKLDSLDFNYDIGITIGLALFKEITENNFIKIDLRYNTGSYDGISNNVNSIGARIGYSFILQKSIHE